MLLETDATGTETDLRYFVYGNYIDEVLVMHDIDGEDDYYYAHDHLYCATALFGDTGAVAERYEYDAYGKVQVLTPNYELRTASLYGNPYTFTGRRLDALDNGSLKLMYYRARTYDPQTGRFMQRDPLGVNPAGGKVNPFKHKKQYSDGMNIYSYTQGNPVNSFDLFGLDSYFVSEHLDPVDIGFGIAEEIVGFYLEKGLTALREQFPNTYRKLEYGPGVNGCAGGRKKHLKMHANINKVIEFKETTYHQDRSASYDIYDAYIDRIEIKYWICRCPCSGNERWKIVKSVKSDTRTISGWTDEHELLPGIGLPVFSWRTYTRGNLDIWDCAWKVDTALELPIKWPW